ncbi:MAG: 5'-deoxynucleotidase [Clostridiales bacterium]|jgi:5'-deoxynucleotidase|nr:5'-deoxynucleotidase [Bacillota bacterium]NLL54385.1 5'-deoxynucleotidase [Clostridiales bacterium]
MQSHFYAYMARMKFVRRWNLRRNTLAENDQEHSLQVAMIAHALAVIRKKRYGGTVDLEKLMLLAVYHEAPEVITGDVATPIKYFNPGIKDAFKDIERIAAEKLLSYLPQDLQDAYGPLLIQDESTPEWRLMKAADRICAYLKCVEEESYGNNEFTSAKESILSSIKGLGVPETEDFLREFAPSFALPLDALN